MGPSADQSSYISWLSDLVPPSLLASPCRKQPHGALAPSGKTRSRDDLVRQRHEPRSLLKHHTEIKERTSAKMTNEIDFKTACRSAHVLADNDVLKILPGKQAK